MVSLGFGKFARSDRSYALEPLLGEERGDGHRCPIGINKPPDSPRRTCCR
jgi:hypothetical protein